MAEREIYTLSALVIRKKYMTLSVVWRGGWVVVQDPDWATFILFDLDSLAQRLLWFI